MMIQDADGLRLKLLVHLYSHDLLMTCHRTDDDDDGDSDDVMTSSSWS